MGRPAARRDYYPAADEDVFVLDAARWALLVLLVGALSFLLGYYRRKTPPAKPTKQQAIEACPALSLCRSQATDCP
jgi:hypothetical protein